MRSSPVSYPVTGSAYIAAEFHQSLPVFRADYGLKPVFQPVSLQTGLPAFRVPAKVYAPPRFFTGFINFDTIIRNPHQPHKLPLVFNLAASDACTLRNVF
jgi:hypothetical protein